MATNYTEFYSYNFSAFQSGVNSLIANGYSLAGGVQVTYPIDIIASGSTTPSVRYVQALYK